VNIVKGLFFETWITMGLKDKKKPKKTTERYDVSEFVEAQFEPGSRRRVLKDLLGIARKRVMDHVEL